MSGPGGKVITFYSYKGGTGRSMALANVAWILASNGKRVLAIDWDLEAPGLHRYFHPFLVDKSLTASDGVIDFVTDFSIKAMTPLKNRVVSGSWFLPYTNILRYASSLEWPFPRPGALDFIHAGRQGPFYSARVSSFNWQDFYQKLGGGGFLDTARKRMKEEYDYVLIDSRTGVSDTSGICTVQMPDILVICFTLNNQSIDGAAGIAASVCEQRKARGITILPVPMRVELAEQKKREAREEYARKKFGTFLRPEHLRGRKWAEYWGEIPFIYHPYYAYEEILAPFGDSPGKRPSMLASAETLCTYLCDGEKVTLSPPTEVERRRVLRLFEADPSEAPPAEERIAAAEQFFARLGPDERASAWRVLSRLVHLDEVNGNVTETARRVRLADLDERGVTVVSPLVSAGVLLVEDDGATGDGTLRLAADGMVQGWSRLRELVKKDQDFLLWRQQVGSRIAEWERSNRKRQALLEGHLLEEAEAYRDTRAADLSGKEISFIDLSRSERQGRSGRRVATRVAAAAAFALLLAFGFYFYTKRDRRPFVNVKTSTLTTSNNVVRAALSPKGDYFVYSTDDGRGKQSLLLGRAALRGRAAEDATRIVLPSAEVWYESLHFSSDGADVYFVRYDGNSTTGSIYRLPLAGGGTPQKLVEGLPRFLIFTLSPDARQAAFIRNNPELGVSTLVAADLTGAGGERVLSTRYEPIRFLAGPAWSPDGKVIACADKGVSDNSVSIVGVQVADASERLITSRTWRFIEWMEWLADGSGIVLLASDMEYGPYQMWLISYPGGEVRRITDNRNSYDSVSVSSGPPALLSVEDKLTANVWVAPAGRSEEARQLPGLTGTQNDFWGFSWTPDGRVLYVSTGGGGEPNIIRDSPADRTQDIWIMDADGSNRRRLTSNSRNNFDPVVTPDGRQVVFASARPDSINIWRMNLDGTEAVQLTRGVRDFAPSCSPDGRWVVYVSEISKQLTLWRVPVGGGPQEQLTTSASQWPAVSPDGKRIACFYVDGQVIKLAVIPFEGGAPVMPPFEIAPTVGTWGEVRWVDGGRALTYVDTRDGVSNIWSQPLDRSQPRQLTNFKEDRIFRYEWSRDGSRLILSRGSVKRNVVLITQD